MAIFNSMITLTMLISMVHSHQVFVFSFITCNIHQYPYLSNMHPEKINNGNVKHVFHQIGHVFEFPCDSVTTPMCIYIYIIIYVYVYIYIYVNYNDFTVMSLE